MLRKLKNLLALAFLLCGCFLPAEANVAMDFDGDGRTDPTVVNFENLGNQNFRAYWHVLRSRDGYSSAQWGGGRQTADGFVDFFVPADYDGDGKTDIAVWRTHGDVNYPAPPGLQSYYYILYSSTNTYAAIPWGRSRTSNYDDIPVPQDYDGDGKTDIAVYRVSADGNIYWWILQSSDGRIRGDRFGLGGDELVRGDFDGDGKADLAVARPSTFSGDGTFTFYILQTSNGALKSATIGSRRADLIMPPSDFDGDGKDDIALYSGVSAEFSNGYWKFIRSSDNQVILYKFGLPTDTAAPGDYDGDGKTDLAVYRRDPLAQCNVPSYFYVNGSLTGFQSIQFGSCHGAVSY